MIAGLRKRWQAGVFLTAFAGGQAFEPLGVAVRGPAPGEMAARFGDVQTWAQRWQRGGPALLRVEYAQVGGRVIGSNIIPCRAWIDSYDQLWALLGVSEDVRRFTGLAGATQEQAPRLLPWLISHPMRVLGLADCWPQIVATVVWIDQRQQRGMYLRQVDVPGADTKFIERHRGVLADLLDLQLGPPGADSVPADPGRIDPAAPRSDFAGRYRFRKKPQYVRFRLPGSGITLGCGEFSELSLRVEEIRAAPVGVSAAYVIENEITYLAFPAAEGAMVIFGGGYAVAGLESLGWLAAIDVTYWGDVDTHGFAILNQLRRRFPHARSVLMDRATLLAHRSQWVSEPSPVDAPLDLLGADEAALYRDLVSGALGPSVRLEQERVRYSAIERAVREEFRPWPGKSPGHGNRGDAE